MLDKVLINNAYLRQYCEWFFCPSYSFSNCGGNPQTLHHCHYNEIQSYFLKAESIAYKSKTFASNKH